MPRGNGGLTAEISVGRSKIMFAGEPYFSKPEPRGEFVGSCKITSNKEAKRE